MNKMKAAIVKTYPGCTIYSNHDSSKCVPCAKIKFYYEEFQPLLHQLRKIMEVKVCGIITFLNTWVKCENSPGNDTLLCLFSELDLISDSKPVINHTRQSNVKLKKEVKKLNKLFSSCSASMQDFFSKYHDHFYKSISKKIEDYDEKKGLTKCDVSKPGKKVKTKDTEITMTPKKSCKRKVSSDKMPTKGSIKRRRQLQEKLSERNLDYTDDIFDESTFYSINDLDEIQILPSACVKRAKKSKNSSSSSDYSGVETPTWEFSLSPRAPSPTPSEELPYTIDISVEKLKETRKNAEAYQYRRRKLRKDSKKQSKIKNVPVVTAKDLGPSSSYSMEDLYSFENPFKEEDDYDSEEERDDYFANTSDSDA